MKKKIVLIVSVVVAAIIILIIAIPTEKDRVKKDIKSLKSAVESENNAETLKFLDEEYKDKYNIDYKEFTALINDFFRQFDSIKVVMSGLKVTIDSIDKQKNVFAQCSLGLKVFAKYGGDRVLIFGGVIKPTPIRAYLRKTDTQYKIYYTEY